MHVSAVSAEAGGTGFPWNGSYRHLWAARCECWDSDSDWTGVLRMSSAYAYLLNHHSSPQKFSLLKFTHSKLCDSEFPKRHRYNRGVRSPQVPVYSPAQPCLRGPTTCLICPPPALCFPDSLLDGITRWVSPWEGFFYAARCLCHSSTLPHGWHSVPRYCRALKRGATLYPVITCRGGGGFHSGWQRQSCCKHPWAEFCVNSVFDFSGEIPRTGSKNADSLCTRNLRTVRVPEGYSCFVVGGGGFFFIYIYFLSTSDL